MNNTRKYGLWERVLAFLIAVAMVLIPVEIHDHAHAEEPQQQEYCYSYTSDWTTNAYTSGGVKKIVGSSGNIMDYWLIKDGKLAINSGDRSVITYSVVKDGVDLTASMTDYTVSAEFTAPTAGMNTSYQTGFIIGSGSHFYLVTAYGPSYIRFYELTDDLATANNNEGLANANMTAKGSSSSGITLTTGMKFKLTVTVSGTSISAQITTDTTNGTVRNFTAESAVSAGGVGLYSGTWNTGSIDNFELELTDGTVYTEDFTTDVSYDTYLNSTSTTNPAYPGKTTEFPHNKVWEKNAAGHKQVCSACDKELIAQTGHSWVDGECSVCEYVCAAHNFPATDPDKCSVCGISAVCFKYNTSWVIKAYASSNGGIRAYTSGNVVDKYMVNGGVLSIMNNDNTELVPTITENGQAITNWSNYTASVDFNHHYRGGNTMSGIVVGKTEGTYYIVYTYYNNIRIAAVTDTAGTAANEGMIGFGTGSTLVQEQTASGVSIATGEYHTLNVKVEGNTISAWIDDSTVVATYTVPEGSSIASAAPALFTRTILSGSDAFEAKNFKVTVGGKTYNVAFDDADGSLSADTYNGAAVEEGHKWAENWTPKDASQHQKVCLNGCGTSKVAAHDGTSDGWDRDDNNHWHVWSCCGGMVDAAQPHNVVDGACECGLTCVHEWVDGVCTKCDATCDHAAHTDHEDSTSATCQQKAYCGVCGEYWGEIAQHAAADGSALVGNATHHWYDCKYGCGYHIDEALHDDEGGVADCSTLAVCSCGMSHGEVDPSNHTGTASWDRNEDGHIKVYTCCSNDVRVPHDFEGGNGTCVECAYTCEHNFTNSDTCTLCGIDAVCYHYIQKWTIQAYNNGVLRDYSSGNVKNKYLVENGKITVLNNDHSALKFSLVQDGTDIAATWTNYTVSADITQNYRGGNTMVGIIVGGSDGVYYLVSLYYNNIKIYKLVDDLATTNVNEAFVNLGTTSTALEVSGANNISIAEGATVTLKVTVDGKTISAQVNSGNAVTYTADTAVSAGAPTLFTKTVYNADKGGAQFDNFKVTVDGKEYVDNFDIPYGNLADAAYAGHRINCTHIEKWETTAQTHKKICGNTGCTHVFEGTQDHTWDDGVCDVCSYECGHAYDVDPDVCPICGEAAVCFSYNTYWLINAHTSSGAIRGYTANNVVDKYMVSGGVLSILNNDNTELVPTITENGQALTNWTNYTVSVDFLHNHRDGNTMSGIVVGKTEGTYYIVTTYYNNIRIYAVTDTAGTTANEAMVGLTTSSAVVTSVASGVDLRNATDFHTLNVKVEGNTISAWIDNSTVVATYTVPEGSSIASAAPALFSKTVYSAANGALEFKNFKVTIGTKTYDVAFDDANGSLSADTYDGASVKKGHAWPENWTAKDATEHQKVCLNGCGATKTAAHDGNTDGWDYDDNNHWHVWSCCGQIVDGTTAAHDMQNGACTAGCGKTCDHNWVGGVCTVCGDTCQHPDHEDSTSATCQNKAYCGVCGEYWGEVAEHAAADGSVLVGNATHHWYDCKYGCGLHIDEELHNSNGGGATCQAAAVCSCGMSHGTVDADNHIGTLTWDRNEDGHIKGYTCCPNDVRVDHNFVDGNGTCVVCAYTCGHDFTNSNTCTLCGIEEVCYQYTQLWLLNQYTETAGLAVNKSSVSGGSSNTSRFFQNTHSVSGGRLQVGPANFGLFDGTISIVKDGVDLAQSWTDYTVEIEITLDPDHSGNYTNNQLYGVVVRDSGDSRYFISVDGYGYVSIHKQVDAVTNDDGDVIGYNSTRDTHVARSDKFTNNRADWWGKTVKLTVTVDGNTISATASCDELVDNKEFNMSVSYTDEDADAPTMGSAGFLIRDNARKYYIDNFKVVLEDGTVYQDTFNIDYENMILDEQHAGYADYAGTTVNVAHTPSWSVTAATHQSVCGNNGCTYKFDAQPVDHNWVDGKCTICEHVCQHSYTVDPDFCDFCNNAAVCHKYYTSIIVKAFTSTGLQRANTANNVVGKYGIANGVLSLTGTDVCELPLTVIDKNGQNPVNVFDGLTDYTVSVDFTKYYNNGNTMVGIIIGGGNTRYLVDIYFSNIRIYKMVDDPTTAAREDLNGFGTGDAFEFDQYSLGMNMELGKQYTLNVKVEGNKISAWVSDGTNESVVIKYTADTTIESGAPALFAKGYYSAAEGGLTFDNFKVVTAAGVEYVETFSTDGAIESADYPGTEVELGHDWPDGWTYEDAQKHGKTCQRANCTAHKSQAHTSTETATGYNDTHHWTSLGCCEGAIPGTEEEHVFVDGVCGVCNAVCTHAWVDGVCSRCDAVCDHSHGNLSNADCQNKAVCKTCGASYGALGNHSWGAYESNANEHWRECKVPGCQEKDGPTAHSGGNATCNTQAVCSCGTSYGELNPDNHTDKPVWTRDETKHSMTYTCCGAGNVTDEAHTWRNGVCTVCAYTCQHGTSGTTPCSICGIEEICHKYEQFWLLNQYNNKNNAAVNSSYVDSSITSVRNRWFQNTHRVKGGKLSVKTGYSWFDGTFSVVKDGNDIAANWTDYTVSADITFDPSLAGSATNMTGNELYGLVIRDSGDSRYIVVMNCYGAIQIRKQVNTDTTGENDTIYFNGTTTEGNNAILAASKNSVSDRTIWWGKTVTITVTVEGNTITATISSEELPNIERSVTWTDEEADAPTKGNAGFFVFGAREILFDNFEVTLKDGAVYGDDFEINYDNLIMDDQHEGFAGYTGTTVNVLHDKKLTAQGSDGHRLVCSVCDKPFGSVEEHDWVDGKCDDCEFVCPHDFITDPDVCSICGKAAICHKYYTSIIVKAFTSTGLQRANTANNVVGKYGIANGVLSLTGTDVCELPLTVIDKNGQNPVNVFDGLTDYTVSVDFTKYYNNGNTMVGIIVGGGNTRYLVDIYFSNIRIYKMVDDPATAAREDLNGFGTGDAFEFDQYSLGMNLELGKQYTLNVKVEGNKISAWVSDGTNESVVIKYTADTTIESGAPALFAKGYYSAAEGGLTFDNFKVVTAAGVEYVETFSTDGAIESADYPGTEVELGHDWPDGWTYEDAQKHGMTCQRANCTAHKSQAHTSTETATGYNDTHHWTGLGCCEGAIPGTEEEHVFVDGICGECGAVCTHAWVDGVCSRCDAVCDHSHGNLSNADCQNKAVCKTCGASYGELGNHSWGAYESNANEHWRFCKIDGCGAMETPKAHSGGNATCNTQAVCSCGTSYGELNPDNHTDKPVWTRDETKHSKTYTCCGAGNVTDEAHTWRNGVCTVCAYTCQHGTSGTTPCSICGIEEICHKYEQFWLLNQYNNKNNAAVNSSYVDSSITSVRNRWFQNTHRVKDGKLSVKTGYSWFDGTFSVVKDGNDIAANWTDYTVSADITFDPSLAGSATNMTGNELYGLVIRDSGDSRYIVVMNCYGAIQIRKQVNTDTTGENDTIYFNGTTTEGNNAILAASKNSVSDRTIWWGKTVTITVTVEGNTITATISSEELPNIERSVTWTDEEADAPTKGNVGFFVFGAREILFDNFEVTLKDGAVYGDDFEINYDNLIMDDQHEGFAGYTGTTVNVLHDKKLTAQGSDGHRMVCSVCDKPFGSLEEHQWVDGKCSVCTYECQHDFTENPDDCVNCGDAAICHKYYTSIIVKAFTSTGLQRANTANNVVGKYGIANGVLSLTGTDVCELPLTVIDKNGQNPVNVFDGLTDYTVSVDFTKYYNNGNTMVGIIVGGGNTRYLVDIYFSNIRIYKMVDDPATAAREDLNGFGTGDAFEFDQYSLGMNMELGKQYTLNVKVEGNKISAWVSDGTNESVVIKYTADTTIESGAPALFAKGYYSAAEGGLTFDNFKVVTAAGVEYVETFSTDGAIESADYPGTEVELGHAWPENWTYEDAEKHGKTCQRANCTAHKSQAHNSTGTTTGYNDTHHWTSLDCCEGALSGTAEEHDFVDGVCSVCNAVCTHAWVDGVCSRCDAVCDHSHGNLSNADCQNKAVCKICGESYGELGGHVWGAYESNADEHWRFCKIDGCGAMETPKPHSGGFATCNMQAVCACGTSYGAFDPNNHHGLPVWIRGETKHSKTYTCCGAEGITNEAHTWRNGVCTVCAYTCQHGASGTTPCSVCGIEEICHKYEQFWLLNQYNNKNNAAQNSSNVDSSVTSAWNRWFQNTHRVKGGKLSVKTGYSWFDGTFSVVKDGNDIAANWTDYTVSADITFDPSLAGSATNMTGNELYGLVIRDSGDSRYIVVMNCYGAIQIRKQINTDTTGTSDTIYFNGTTTEGNNTILAASKGSVSDRTIWWGKTVTITVTVEGNTITATLSSEELPGAERTVTWTDEEEDAPVKGNAGFFVFGTREILFDNFMVDVKGDAVYSDDFEINYDNLIMDDQHEGFAGYAGTTVNKLHEKELVAQGTDGHKQICVNCGESYTSLEAHKWVDGKCSVCDFECPHDFTADPDKCSICTNEAVCRKYTQLWLLNQYTSGGINASGVFQNANDPSRNFQNSHEVAGGKLHVNAGYSWLDGTLSVIENGEDITSGWTDYTVSADITFPDMTGAHFVGLVVRDSGNARYIVVVNEGGTVQLRKQVDSDLADNVDTIFYNGTHNNFESLASATTKVTAENGTHTLKVTVKGGTFTAWLDDVQVLWGPDMTAEFTDTDPVTSGSAGIFVLGSGRDVYFDNFKVTMANGSVYEDQFEIERDNLIADMVHGAYNGYTGDEVELAHKWATTGTSKDSNVHVVGCLNEGCTATKEFAHDMQDATCVHGSKCSGCEYEIGIKDPDNHEGAPAWTATATHHQKKYSCCGEATTTAEKHDWVNGKCSVCGYECAHDFAADPDKCSICGTAGICKTYTQYWLINQFTSKGKFVTAGSGYYFKPSHSVTGGKFVTNMEASMLAGQFVILDSEGKNISDKWTDYTVSMDVDLPDDQSMSGAKWVALFGRVTETEAYALHITANGYTLYRYSTNVEGMEGFESAESVLFSGNTINSKVSLASKTIAGGLAVNNKGVGTAIGMFNVKMTFSGNNIKVYHNDQLVIDYTDADAIKAGSAAFTVNTGKSDTFIDNFTVAVKNGPTFSDDFATDYSSLILDESHELYDGYKPVSVHTPHTKIYTSDANGHQIVCAVCGIKFTDKQAHAWDDGACKDCGYECVHDFTANPDKCGICGDDAVCRHYSQLWLLNQYSSTAGNASSVWNNDIDPTRNFQNSHEVVDGKLHVNVGYTWFDGTLSVLQNGADITSEWTDYTVSVDISFPDMTGAHAIGLVLRDSGNARYIVVVTESGGVQLRKQVDPDPTDRVDTIFYNGAHRDYVNLASANTGLTAENETRTLTVTVKGGTFTAWLDDVQVMWGPDKTAEFTDAEPVEKGSVGIFVLGSGLDIYFDNFTVDLEKGDTYTDDFSDARDNLIADLGHGAYNGYVGEEFILGHAWPEKATALNDKEHVKKCQHYGCNAQIVEKHSNVTDPTCNAPYGCSGCSGFGEKDPDNHEKDAAYVDNGDGTHKYYYPCCQKVVKEAEKHTLDANGVCTKCKSGCDHDWSKQNGKCQKCGYECPEHFGGEANCMSPKLCERCSVPYGEKGDHVWGAYVSENGRHWRVCSIEGCGATANEGVCKGGTATCQAQAVCTTCKHGYGELADHQWGTGYNSDGMFHWFECTFAGCTERKDVEAHSGGAATDCVTPAFCDKCGEAYGEPLYGVHAGEIGWSHSALSHYKAYQCCGEFVGEEGRHTWDTGVCTVCNFACVHTSATANCQENICPICGQPNGEMNPDNHPGAAIWVSLGSQHKKVYTCCGKDASAPEDHTFGDDGFCTICTLDDTVTDYEQCEHEYDHDCDVDCNICGVPREVGDHVYDNDCDANCNNCNAEREVGDHVYDNDCDANCNNCGAERKVGDHVYDNNCDLTCNICGGYRFTLHIYDNNCDAECNVCGYTRDPDKHVYDDDYDPDCNECGAIREVSERPVEPKPGISTELIIIIAASVLGAGAVAFLILFFLKKKKKKATPVAETPVAEIENATESK